MARGVSYQSGAELLKYTHCEAIFGEYDEESGKYIGNEYNVFESQLAFDDMIGNIKAALQAAFPSFETVYDRRDAGYTIDRYLWINADDECVPVLKNGLCAVFIAEYCGIISLSFCPLCDFDPDYQEEYKRGIQINWIQQAEEKINRCIEQAGPRLELSARFSNGEQMFSKIA